MYTIYIADDNELFRESMVKTTDWKALGCVLCGSAGDGETACREILERNPDIVLMDIRMPGMSGLEAASLLRQNGNRSKVILVTGYSDFGYAQKGIRVGVFDYLLKPVDDTELSNVIARAIQTIEKEKAEAPAPEKPEIVQRGIPQEEMNALLSAALDGSEEAPEKMKRLVMDNLCLVHYELLRACPDGAARENEEPMQDWVRRAVAAFARSREEGTLLFHALSGQALYVLLLFTNIKKPGDDDVAAVSLASRALGEAENTLCISISGCHEQFRELADAREETRFSYDSRFFIENRKVIHYRSLQSRSMANLFPIMLKEEEVQNTLRRNPREVGQELTTLEEMLRKEDVLDAAVVRNILTNLAIMMDAVLAEHKKGGEEQGRGRSAAQEVRGAATLRDAFEVLSRYAVKLSVMAEREGEDKHLITDRVMAYLEEHYAEHISLGDAADYAGVSQGHLCRVLKSDTNDTFVNLLNRIRIRKAKEMLSSHRYKVYEVAEKVGFTNYAYFYQTYRKYTGEAPTKR